jgi:hypothetical protein
MTPDDITISFYVKNPPYSDEFMFGSAMVGSGGISTINET